MRFAKALHLALATAAAALAWIVACAPATETAPATAATAAVPHPDTKAEPGDCNYFNYYHDESKSPAGPSKCSTDCDCDGMRSCKSGQCQGDARPEVDCDSPSHRWNEAWNPMGAGKCTGDCDCDGGRTCVWPPRKKRAHVQAGTCEGVAR